MDRWRPVGSIGGFGGRQRGGGLGARGEADQRRLFFIERGSAFETEHWLERARDRGLDVPGEATARASELSRMLSGLVHRL
jgi:four helix bundle protein